MPLPIGFKHSEETKRRMREKAMGRKLTEEIKQKISKALKGRKVSFSKIHCINLSNSCKGEKNHRWKGGKTKDKKGYIHIYKPNHPFHTKQNYVLEHRFIIEQYLGRFLKPQEVVHHINENPSDNRIKNLIVFKNEGVHKNFHRGFNINPKNIIFIYS